MSSKKIIFSFSIVFLLILLLFLGYLISSRYFNSQNITKNAESVEYSEKPLEDRPSFYGQGVGASTR